MNVNANQYVKHYIVLALEIQFTQLYNNTGTHVGMTVMQITYLVLAVIDSV